MHIPRRSDVRTLDVLSVLFAWLVFCLLFFVGSEGRESDESPGVFATLMFQMPSEVKGGVFTVSDPSSMSSPTSPSAGAALSDNTAGGRSISFSGETLNFLFPACSQSVKLKMVVIHMMQSISERAPGVFFFRAACSPCMWFVLRYNIRTHTFLEIELIRAGARFDSV